MSTPYLIDTSVCVAQLVGVDRELQARWLATPVSRITVCSVVIGELHAGAWGTAHPHDLLARIDRVFAPYRSVPFDDAAAAAYGRVLADLRRSGTEIGPPDTMIAAIALANDLTVVTRNLRHFKRVKGLRVIRW